jgi:hypothetical protein
LVCVETEMIVKVGQSPDMSSINNAYNKMILHRASNSETDISFVEDDCCLLDEEYSTGSDLFPTWKPGSLGSGNELSLLSIVTTEDMLGLSSGCCCTHKRLMWAQRLICGS